MRARRGLWLSGLLVGCSSGHINDMAVGWTPPWSEREDTGAPDSAVDTAIETGESDDSDTEDESDSESDSRPDTDPPECRPIDPVANAGPDLNVAPLDNVRLSGSRSTDPGSCPPLQYRWSLISAPNGSGVQLVDPAAIEQRFMVDLAGTYELQLEVENGLGRVDPTPDRVRIVATPVDGLYVELSWEDSADLDVHLLHPGANLWDTPGDACFCNPNPDWGVAGTTLDDPSLDIDDVDGFGPETITLTQPPSGVYTVAVHYYRGDGRPSRPTRARVRIYTRERSLGTFTADLTRPDTEVWTVARVTWPAATVQVVDRHTDTTRTSCR